MGEEVVNLWEAEDPPDDIEDPVVEQATKSSISASNPWVLLKLVSFVHEKRMVNSSRTPQEKRSLFSENGTFYSLHRRKHLEAIH